ncbi:MAG: hypothetical protein IT444_12000 [Phycisphaeraceae bacterium]|nr:hypothetical protein [Phycisphaeraceae bacterium]
MQFRLAIFDQSTRNPSNQYWTWFHPELTVDLLGRVYDEIISRNLPERPQDLKPGEYAGGAVVIDGWLCCYRVGNGGTDSFGREGRFVPICAFTRAADAKGRNCLEVLESPQLKELARTARDSCPVPAPESLAIDLEVSVAQDATGQLEELTRTGRVEIAGTDVLARAGSLIAALAPSVPFECRLVQSGGGASAIVSKPVRDTNVPPISDAVQDVRPSAQEIRRPQRVGEHDEAVVAPTGPMGTLKAGGVLRRYRLHLAIAIVCLLIGGLSGSVLHSIMTKLVAITTEPAAVAPDVDFLVRQVEEGSSQVPSGKVKLSLELVTRTPVIESWSLDGQPLKGEANRILEAVTYGQHRVEVKYHYADKDGNSHRRKAATISVKHTEGGGVSVDVQPVVD